MASEVVLVIDHDLSSLTIPGYSWLVGSHMCSNMVVGTRRSRKPRYNPIACSHSEATGPVRTGCTSCLGASCERNQVRRQHGKVDSTVTPAGITGHSGIRFGIGEAVVVIHGDMKLFPVNRTGTYRKNNGGDTTLSDSTVGCVYSQILGHISRTNKAVSVGTRLSPLTLNGERRQEVRAESSGRTDP